MKINLITLGDSDAGKTSLLKKFTNDKFTNNHIITVGIDIKTKYVQVDGKTIKMNLFDTAGQERFRTMTMQYFNSTNCVMFVYDTSSEESFNSMRYWITLFDTHHKDRKDLAKVLVGNK